MTHGLSTKKRIPCMRGVNRTANLLTRITEHYERVVWEMQGILGEFVEKLHSLRGPFMEVVTMGGSGAKLPTVGTAGSPNGMERSGCVHALNAKRMQSEVAGTDWRSIARSGDVTPKWLEL
jgi:hypothetical protein